MLKFNYLFFFLLFYFFVQHVLASPIDSLKSGLSDADAEKRIGLYMEISQQYGNLNLDSAEKYASLAENLCRINDISNEDLLNLLADIHIGKQQFEMAISYLQDVLQISIIENDTLEIVNLKNRIGSLYLSLEKYNEALSKHMDVLKLAKQYGSKRAEADALNYIGSIFYRLGNYVDARLYYKKSLIRLEELNDSIGESYIYNNLGEVYKNMGDFEQAMSCCNKSLEIKKRYNNSDGIAISYNSIAEIYELQYDFENAINYFQSSLKLWEQENNSYGIIETNINLARVYRKISKLAIAKTLLNKSLILANSKTPYRILIKLYNELSFTYETGGDYESALKYYKKFSELKDSIKKERNSSALHEMRINLDNQNKEEQIKKLEEEKRVEQKALARQKEITIYAYIALLVTLILSLSLFRQYKLRKKVNVRLSDKNKSLKTAEKSLIWEKAILNSMLNSIPHPVFYKDISGRYTRANPEFYNHTGFSEDEIIGKSDFELYPENQAKEFEKSDKKIIEEKASERSLNWDVSHTGKNVLFDTIKSPFLDPEGNVMGIVGISLDVTDRHNFEQELKKQKEKAEQADRSKSVFLANMSHDIRSPMNAIIGFSDIVAQSLQADSQAIEYLGYVKQSGNSLLSLIDDIIDIAKIEAGQLKLRQQPFGLNILMNELFVSFQTIINQKPNNRVVIKLNVPDNSENIGINSDEMRLKQVLTNFLSNAIKFTDEGSIELGYQFLPKKELLFYVKDSGVGISKDQQELIFQRFGQVEDTYTRNYSGTGLGLAISQSIINLLGGDIWVDSELGKGANFYFKIPSEIIESQVGQDANPNLQFKHYNWKNKQILVVEDDIMSLKLLKSVLIDTEVKLITANDGHEVIELLEENTIDLVLMDIQLPELNGFDATRKIKEQYENIPVIAISAYAMQTELEKAKTVGYDLFISKPFDINHLLSSIDKFLDR